MIEIIKYEHAGIRVSDRRAAITFYSNLGFSVDTEFSDSVALELANGQGIRLNLICNAVPTDRNVLQDEAVKYPGITHVAFVVASLENTIAAMEVNGWSITEGPKETERRRYLFTRDPDGNVIELNELKRRR